MLLALTCQPPPPPFAAAVSMPLHSLARLPEEVLVMVEAELGDTDAMHLGQMNAQWRRLTGYRLDRCSSDPFEAARTGPEALLPRYFADKRPDVRGPGGTTVAMQAALACRRAVVAGLLQSGASPTALCDAGNNVAGWLDIGIEGARIRCVRTRNESRLGRRHFSLLPPGLETLKFAVFVALRSQTFYMLEQVCRMLREHTLLPGAHIYGEPPVPRQRAEILMHALTLDDGSGRALRIVIDAVAPDGMNAGLWAQFIDQDRFARRWTARAIQLAMAHGATGRLVGVDGACVWRRVAFEQGRKGTLTAEMVTVLAHHGFDVRAAFAPFTMPAQAHATAMDSCSL